MRRGPSSPDPTRLDSAPVAPVEIVDPARCPLCGGPNGCHRAAGLEGRCWCYSVRFPPSLLARVPERARNRACICRRCVEAEASG